MATQHTPGPHKVDGKNTTTAVTGFNTLWGGGELLAYVARDGDAALYAAAPDLLKALNLCVARDLSLKHNAMVMDALAKAEGC